MSVFVCDQPFDPWQALSRYQGEALADRAGQFGATAVFVGSMRDFNQGDEVVGMRLEHYPGMTEKLLMQIAEQAATRWQVLDSLIIHRVGQVQPSDALVLVAVWSAHRGDAFDASRFIMEELKSRAPFWKQETLVSGETRWVETNSCGYQR